MDPQSVCYIRASSVVGTSRRYEQNACYSSTPQSVAGHHSVVNLPNPSTQQPGGKGCKCVYVCV